MNTALHTLHGEREVGFAIGTGRCGTNFIARAVQMEPGISAVHERNPYNESFHRYCKWYSLPVDVEGFLHQKEVEIRQDLEKNTFSFEASAYLSLAVVELYERFNAKFLLLVRSPERVVNSFLRKGWYLTPTVRKDPDLAPSYQECESFHHVLARIVPSGEKFLQWNGMSRIGKIAWFWNALNTRVLEKFSAIPETHWRIEKIEEFSYSRYKETTQFLGFESRLSQQDYEVLAKQRPNSFSNVPTTASWSPQEIHEFEAEVAPAAEQLGYEFRVDHLPLAISLPVEPAVKTSLFDKLRSSLIK